MKNLFFLVLTTFSFYASATSADYHCTRWRYQVDLTIDGKSSFVRGYDTSNWNLFAHSYVNWIEVQGTKTTLHFSGFEGPLKITFNSEQMNGRTDVLKGWIDGKASGFPIWDSLDCQKQ